MSDQTLEMPKHAPRPMQKVYTAIACGAAFVSVVTLGLNNVGPAKEAVISSLRALHIMAPPAVHDVGSLATG